jgi:FkbM family methyltransferase
MNRLRALWASLISGVIWAIERAFFYPKLATAYSDLKFTKSKKGLVVFDIGANRGQSIRFFVRIFLNPSIYAFEPSVKTFCTLKKNVDKIKGPEISIFQIGIGDSNKTITFFESLLNETSSFVLPNEASSYFKRKNLVLLQKSKNAYKTVPTMVTTVDAFVKEKRISKIDVMKIDVEGYELQVLNGARDILRAGGVQVIQLERHADDMRIDTYPEIHKLLITLGYIKVKEIKHPFGDFFEILYQKE